MLHRTTGLSDLKCSKTFVWISARCSADSTAIANAVIHGMRISLFLSVVIWLHWPTNGANKSEKRVGDFQKSGAVSNS